MAMPGSRATPARDGVHLAAGSDANEARRLLGKDALIGLSIHGAEEARAVDARSVDYVIAGPVFETASKPGYGPALGPDGLALIAKASPVPVIAIGGIDPENAPDCRAAGAQRYRGHGRRHARGKSGRSGGAAHRRANRAIARDQQKWVPVLQQQSSLRRLRILICGSRANL